MNQLYEYRFTLGRSYPTGVGVCFSVIAATEQEALKKADELVKYFEGKFYLHVDAVDPMIYIHFDKLTSADIENIEPYYKQLCPKG